MCYYNFYGVECYELIDLFLQPAKKEEGFYLGNVIKYIYRAGNKQVDTEYSDIEKALVYFKKFLNMKSKSYIDNFQLRISYEKYNNYCKCFTSMPKYKYDFFSQLLFCGLTGQWHLGEIYNILKDNVEEVIK